MLFRLVEDKIIHTASRLQISKSTLQTLSSVQTPPNISLLHCVDDMSELTDSNTGLAMISSYTPGGWVGGSHLHNNATLWPNLQVRTCKNSSQVEFQVGLSVAILESYNSYHQHPEKPPLHHPYTFQIQYVQKLSRHVLNNFQTSSRYPKL